MNEQITPWLKNRLRRPIKTIFTLHFNKTNSEIVFFNK